MNLKTVDSILMELKKLNISAVYQRKIVTLEEEPVKQFITGDVFVIDVDDDALTDEDIKPIIKICEKYALGWYITADLGGIMTINFGEHLKEQLKEIKDEVKK